MRDVTASAGGEYGPDGTASYGSYGAGAVGDTNGAGAGDVSNNGYGTYGTGVVNGSGYTAYGAGYSPSYTAASSTPARSSTPQRRQKWPYVVAGVVTAAAIGAGVFFALGGQNLLPKGLASTAGLPVFIQSAGSALSGAPDDSLATDAGNSSANFANGATVANVDGNDIYIVKGKGIYRTKKDGSDSAQLLALPSQSDLSSDHLSYLNQDGSKIYYVWQSSTGRGNTTEVHALDTTAAAGSNDQTIYKVPATTSSDGDISSPRARAMYLKDHNLYLVTTNDDSSSQQINYTVIQLDESGNQQGQSSFTADSGSQQTMSAGKLYYVYTDGQSSAIYSQDLDGSNEQQVYASTLDDGSAGSIGAMAISNSKLYCTERKASDSTAAPSLVQMDLDGSNKQTLYTADSSTSGSSSSASSSSSTSSGSSTNASDLDSKPTDSLVVTNGNAYLLPATSTSSQLVIVPTNGSDAQTVNLSSQLSNAEISTSGDHLVMSGTDQSGKSVVCSLDYQGNQIGTYDVSSENSNASKSDASNAKSSDNSTVQVKDSVDAYSWDELKQISQQIAAASSDSEGLQIAEKYHLCSTGGKLDGTQSKDVTLTDGTKSSAIIVGFRHDTKSDGSGKAGITFMFKDAIAQRSMNAGDASSTGSNSGGWKQSQLRSWLSSDGMGLLPDDLRKGIVQVKKLTNNSDTSKGGVPSATATDDSLWLFSFNEICGDYSGWRSARQETVPVFQEEGTTYQLFTDTSNSNSTRVKSYQGQASFWLERSPDAYYADRFMDVDQTGNPSGDVYANDTSGVVPGFCI
ncbi:MAG: DUF6273 domain-containing protein [Atopobiaceae bacterium]